MVKSSQTFELNNSNGITTNDYCDCDAPDYVNKGRSKDELCAGNVKLAGNIEKQGNSNLQQLLIVSGPLNYLLVFCSMFCFYESQGLSTIIQVESSGHGRNRKVSTPNMCLTVAQKLAVHRVRLTIACVSCANR